MIATDTLQLVLATSMDAVIVMRSDGSVGEWSDEAARIFGWRRDEVLDREMAQFIVPPQHRDQHHAGLRHYLATGEGPVLRRRIEITGLRKSGEEFPIELSISPVTLGGEDAFLAFVRDVSEAQATIITLKRQAHEAAVLHRVASLAAESTSLDEVIRICLESICDLLGWPVGHAFMARPDSEHLLNHIWAGEIDRYQRLIAATDSIEFRRGVGLPGRVWANEQSEWIEDIGSGHSFVRGSSDTLNIGAAFAMPISVQGQVVAVLEFFSPAPLKSEPALLMAAQVIAAQAGRAVERHRDREHQLLLSGELEHRTKNLLAVVAGMATQTAKGATSLDAYVSDFSQRLASLSKSYSVLTKARWGPTSLRDLIDEVVRPHLSLDAAQLDADGGELFLPAKTALSVGLILHELTTNAAKYGALSRPCGRIHIHWQTSASPSNLTRIVWSESGVVGCLKPEKSGFGSKLIRTSAKHDLGGSVQVTYGPDGVNYEFVFPMAT